MSELTPRLDHVPAFLCGPHASAGPKPTFIKEGSTTIRTFLTAPADWAGLGTILHGGFQSLLLDDMMCRVASGLTNGEPAVSNGLTLRYHRPVQVNRPLSLFGYLVEDRGSEVITCGEIKDSNGNLLTEAEGSFSRTPWGAIEPAMKESALGSTAQPGFDSLAQWPAWTACCNGPLERLWNLHVNWRLAPDRSALGGVLCFPPALRQIPPAGILGALFDQTLGLLGNLQGDGVMLTVRLQVTLYGPLPIGEELFLLGMGNRWREGPFKTQAWLQYKDFIVGEANGNFVLPRR